MQIMNENKNIVGEECTESWLVTVLFNFKEGDLSILQELVIGK